MSDDPTQEVSIGTNTNPGSYGVQLVYKKRPAMAEQTLLEALSTLCPDIEPRENAREDHLLTVIHGDTLPDNADEEANPLHTIISKVEKPFRAVETEPVIQQSWRWKKCRKVLPNCQESVLVADAFAEGLSHQERLERFQKTLAGILQKFPCEAIYWQPAYQYVDPRAFLKAMENRGYDDPVTAALNVRFYRAIIDPPDPRAPMDNMLMDSMGLMALGLPDFQCYYRSLDPDDVSNMIYNAAYYTFLNGPVIKEGHTLQEPESESAWICRFQESILTPRRVVLDLDPGPPYAAGTPQPNSLVN